MKGRLLKLKPWTSEHSLNPGGRYFVLYTYWTNFNKKRARTNDYEVLPYDAEGYWQFVTTIDPEYLENMTSTNRNRFLFQMEEHYHRATN